MASKDNKNDKVFDVAKPGKTAASASSRPLIVGHKSILKDPMVKEVPIEDLDEAESVKIDQPIEEDTPSGSPELPSTEESSTTKKKSKLSAPSESKIIINPLSSDKSNKSDVKDSDDDDGDSKVTVKVKSKPAAEAATAAAATGTMADESDEPATDSAEKADAPADESESKAEVAPSPDEKESESSTNDGDDNNEATTETSTSTLEQLKADRLAEAEANKKAELQKMIATKKYYAPIGEKTRKRRSLKHILLGALMILLLGGALAYLMIDVGIIKADVDLPYEFFKNNNTTITPAATVSTTKVTPTPTSATPSTGIYKGWKTYIDKSGNLSVKYPTTWTLAAITGKQGDQITTKATLKSPTGTVLHLDTDGGGRGGQCEPAATDVAFKTGNLCPSVEYLSKADSGIKNVYVATDDIGTSYKPATVQLITKHYATGTGKSSYVIGLTVETSSYKITLNKPEMGYLLELEHFLNSNSKGAGPYYIYAYSSGTNQSFLTSKDAEVVKNILKSMVVTN